MIKVFQVKVNKHIRLATLNKEEAVQYAQHLFRDEEVEPEIFEIEREPKDHRK